MKRTCWCLGIALLLGCSSGGRASVDAGTGGASSGGAVGSAGTGAGGTGTGGNAGTGPAVTGIVLAAGEDSPSSIAIDATNVYWTTNTEIRTVSKSGGAVTTVYGSEGGPFEVNVDDTNLYWFHVRPGSGDQRDVVRAPKNGAGPITLVATGTVEAGGLVSDADSLYWGIPDGVNGILERVPKAGGVAPTPLVEQLYIGVLALDDQYLYWGVSGPARVQRILKTGGTVQDIATGEPQVIGQPIPDATDVYFFSEWNETPPEHVAKMPKNGGPVTTLATGLDPITQLALAQDAVYAMVDFGPGKTGYIAKVPKTGGGATKLVTDTVYPQYMVVDDQYVYWTEPGVEGAHAARIRRIPR